MVEFVNEPVSVETRRRCDGTSLPLAFVWRGRRYQIESWGREGADICGGRAVRSHLVQTAGQESWELQQDQETAQWVLARHWAGRHRVV